MTKCTDILLISFLFLTACSSERHDGISMECEDFSVMNLTAADNIESDKTGKKILFLDYDHATQGFVIPSEKQNEKGIAIEFDLKNISGTALFYKIYYQNESYKFPEFDSLSGKENPLAEENFYGSWLNSTEQFKKLDIPADGSYHRVKDHIRIQGNPRNEARYIQQNVNNRWQRNPRVGEYSILLVVATEEDLKAIPDHIRDISKMSRDHYSHPYAFFFSGDGKDLKHSVRCKVEHALSVVARPDLGTGIYIEEGRFNGTLDRSAYCAACGPDSTLYHVAPFQQFVHYVDASTKMENIPVVADILKDNYSKMDYNWNRAFYRKEELIPTVMQTSRKPCSTVFSDPKEHKIIIKNPKTKYGEWKKENVGVITRHGLTYGKYRVKVKLTELLNKNNVWNGLTNAIWLITQSEAEWNFRRAATKDGGYMATYWGGANDKRVPQVGYTEIDFEILKTPPYCPDNTFPPVYKNPGDNAHDINSWNTAMPSDITDKDGSITVACTNWDMAAHDPVDFGVGCNPVNYEGKVFEAHRWDHNYRALTQKKEELDDELFAGEYFYFEIDWRPTEIIWRIGAEPNKMRVVGYMNDKVTSIANNQMLLIITQEYHNTKWWPGTPYSQDNLPFPLNDIPGEIYELTIE